VLSSCHFLSLYSGGTWIVFLPLHRGQLRIPRLPLPLQVGHFTIIQVLILFTATLPLHYLCFLCFFFTTGVISPGGP
jgi:hypothetical protein